jgi:signal transducing adaptor molecule
LEFIQLCSFEFRADSTLGLMNEVYHSLRAEGVQFPSPQKPKKEFTQSELDKQKEEEEFQLALALSLSESENKRPSFKASETTTTTTAATTNTNKKVLSINIIKFIILKCL